MSVFRVKLTQGNQGNMDENAVSTGTSIQRSVWIMGPHKINRLLNDGDTFTDSNYWKRHAYPQVAREFAVVEVVTDDGSVYVDGPNGEPSSSTHPVVYDFSLGATSTFAVNTAAGKVADVLSDHGSHAVYTRIYSDVAIKVKVNGVATFDVPATTYVIFNPGDLDITLMEFQNDTGGTATVQVLVSVFVQSVS